MAHRRPPPQKWGPSPFRRTRPRRRDGSRSDGAESEQEVKTDPGDDGKARAEHVERQHSKLTSDPLGPNLCGLHGEAPSEPEGSNPLARRVSAGISRFSVSHLG